MSRQPTDDDEYGSETSGNPNAIRIDREIGDDPEELDAIAAEVVAGKPLERFHSS